MRIITDPGKAELVIRRSRFIAETFSVQTQEEAREKLRAQKERWAPEGIRHLVHAFVLGGSGGIVGCSDDGEPPGTAGRPALEVLKGAGITNVILTIARIFGGIKLGTGGLVQAYGDSAKAVLAVTGTQELVPMKSFRLECPYSFYERAKQILAALEAVEMQEAFSQQVAVCGRIKEAVWEMLCMQMRDASRGAVVVQEAE